MEAVFSAERHIDGFRATHQPSPWISDYGQFVLMPQRGELQLDAKARSPPTTRPPPSCGPITKNSSSEDGITAELTATERAAVFR